MQTEVTVPAYGKTADQDLGANVRQSSVSIQSNNLGMKDVQEAERRNSFSCCLKEIYDSMHAEVSRLQGDSQDEGKQQRANHEQKFRRISL
jgi:hypothetical protein